MINQNKKLNDQLLCNVGILINQLIEIINTFNYILCRN